LSRTEAGKHILDQGFEAQVLRRIERAYERCSSAWLALFGTIAGSAPLPWTVPYPVPEQGRTAWQPDFSAANRFALAHRVNAIFCSRASILLFKTHTT
jgi:hypothetical protein